MRSDEFGVSEGYRRYVLGLLFVVYVVNFVDRSILNILLEPIKREFLRLADQVTEADLQEADAALEEQSKKITKRPRRAENEDE